MSELAIAARAKAREKVERLTRATKGNVDASGWREPLGEQDMAPGLQTGPRPVSPRQFRRGGKVHGEVAKFHAGRKPRSSGGMTADEFLNRNVKEANEKREGPKHVGGMAHGGSCTCSKCGGGRVGKAAGGASYGGTRPQGGRIARASGGRSKKGMNVNIIIAQPHPKPSMPPSGPIPGGPPPGAAAGPVGLHQGMPPPPPMAPPGGPPPMGPPMARKSGGRAGYPITDGAGGGKGRLQKVKAYGAEPQARKSGGRTGYPIKDGAGGGKGRLQKIAAYG
jgi:hypothetical protein